MRAGGAWLWVAVLVAAGGCLESSVVVCADGRICPAGLVCSQANARCVSQDQIDACAGKDELATCEVAGAGSGQCENGACLFASCGDGLVEGTETCDGENLGEGTDCLDLGYYDQQPLTCDSSCQLDESVCTGGKCGDGAINGPELCDGMPPEFQCVDLGYSVGALPACTVCEPDRSLCHRIGIERLSLLATEPANDLTGSAPDDVYAIARTGNSNGGPLFHNAGITWLRVFDTAYSVWSLGKADVYATVRRDDQITLQHWDGSDWTVIEGVTPGPNQHVRASGPDDIDLLGGGPVPPMHWDGATWSEIDQLPSRDVLDLWADAGSGTIYLVLADSPGNLLYRFDAEGWHPVASGLERVSAVWGTGPDDVWIGGGKDLGHWHVDAWTLYPDALPVEGDVVSLSGIASDDLYVVTSEDRIVGGGSTLVGHLAHFDGTDWIAVAELPDLHDVWAAGPDAVYMAGNAGTTFRYHGSLWRPEIRLALGPGHAAVDFAFSPTELYAAVNFTAFSTVGLVYRFDGASWSDGVEISSQPLNGLFVAGSAVYAVGKAGLFRRGSGDTWVQQDVAAGSEPVLYGGWAGGPSARFVVGSALFHDVGDGWVETALVADCPLGMRAVWGSDDSDVFAVGSCGQIMHFDGAAWSEMDGGTPRDLTAVWGRSGQDVYAAGVSGTVIRYDGDSWSALPALPIAADLRSISGTAQELIATTAQGLVFHFDGANWSQLEPDAVLDAMVGVIGRKEEIAFMSTFGTDVSVLRLLRTSEWLAR